MVLFPFAGRRLFCWWYKEYLNVSVWHCRTAENSEGAAVLAHFPSSSSAWILGANLESNFVKLEPYLNPERLFWHMEDVYRQTWHIGKMIYVSRILCNCGRAWTEFSQGNVLYCTSYYGRFFFYFQWAVRELNAVKITTTARPKVFLVQTFVSKDVRCINLKNKRGKKIWLSSNCPHGGTLIPWTKKHSPPPPNLVATIFNVF